MVHANLNLTYQNLKKDLIAAIKSQVGNKQLQFATPYPINDEAVIVAIKPSLSVQVTDDCGNEESFKLKDYSLDIQLGILKELETGHFINV